MSDLEPRTGFTPRKAAIVLAIGLLGTGAAGCEQGDTEKLADGLNPTLVSPDHVSPTDSMTAEVNARAVVSYALSGEYVSDDDLEKARVIVRSNPALKDLVAEVDKAEAKDIVQTQDSPYSSGDEVKEAKKKIADIADPDLRKLTTEVADINKLTESIDSYSNLYSSDEEKDDAKDAIKNTKTPIKGAAENAFEAAQAGVIIEDMEAHDYDNDAPEDARKKLSKLGNTALTSEGLKLIDAEEAEKVVESISTDYGKTKKEAMEDLSKIKDPEVKTAAEKAVATYKLDDYGNAEVDDRAKEDLSQITEKQKGKFERVTEKLSEAFKKAGERTTKRFDEKTAPRRDDTDKAITKIVKRFNKSLKLDKKVDIPQPHNRGQVIDLSGVKGTKKVPDIISALGGEEPKKLNQFAEAYVDNGKIKFKVEDGANLKPAARKQLKTAVMNVSPLLGAAFKSGNLSTVRFIISGDDEFNPYFVPLNREIDMILPADKSTSLDQLQSALTHEPVHSLVNSAFEDGATVSKQEFKDIVKACNGLKANTYNELEISLRLYPDILAELEQQAHPKHKQIFSTIAKYVNGDNLDRLMADQWEGIDDFNLEINNCLPDGINGFLDYVGTKLGIENAYDKLDYLKESKAFGKMAEQWVNIQDFLSLYSQLNESNYVKTEYKYKEYLGHSEDDSNEMIASLTDAAISFNKPFVKMIKGLAPDEKKVALNAIHASFEIIYNRHSSLKKHFKGLERDIRRKSR